MLRIDLTGKVALVTGGSGELGRVMVRTLHRCGATVAIHYFRGEDRAKALCEELGERVIAVQADVSEAEQVNAMARTVTLRLGCVDILVNNAVQQYAWTSLLDQSVADFESQFRTSVLHNVLMAKAFVPAMMQRGWGRVIAINTECLMQCHPGQSAYISGKGGQDRLLRVLAREVGHAGVTVNQVAPGWTISQTKPDGPFADGYRAGIPLRRRGTDRDIAHAVAFLASDLAGFITGLYLPVCGGNVMPTI